MTRIRALVSTLLGTVCAACSQGAVEPSQQAAAPTQSAAPPTSPPTASASPAPAPVASAEETAEPVAPPIEAPPVEPAAEPPAGVPAPLYADLFVKDKRWAFRTEEFGRAGKGTCSVAEVRTAEWGVASRITCEGFNDGKSFFTGDPFTGWWAAVPEGLIRLEDRAPTRAPDIEEAMAVLAPKPRSKVAKVLDEREPPFWDEITIRANGTGWCMKELSQGHDAAWWSVCIEPRRGFRAGVIGWRGGVTNEKKFRAE